MLVVAAGAANHAQEPELPGRSWKLAAPTSVADRTTQVNPAAGELDCIRCHPTIVAEWAATRHAQAWNEEVFQEELAEIRRPKKCHSCHAPEPLLVLGVDAPPKVREAARHLGVDCNACHLGPEGAMHGPFGVDSSAHTSVADELFTSARSNELCIGCHKKSVGPVLGIAKDFTDAKLGERGYSCVGCHMAALSRPIATDPAGTEIYPERLGRSHLLQHPRDPSFLRQSFGREVARTPEGVRVAIHNRAGHRLPGLADRRLVFTIELVDAAGSALASEERLVSRNEQLPLGAHLDMTLPALEAAHAVHILGRHSAESLTETVTFLDEHIELPRD